MLNLIPKFIYFYIKYKLRDHIIYSFNSYIKELIIFLKKHFNTKLSLLNDITAFDIQKNKSRFTIVYNLYSVIFNFKFRIKILVHELETVNSIESVYMSSNCWKEKFGICLEYFLLTTVI